MEKCKAAYTEVQSEMTLPYDGKERNIETRDVAYSCVLDLEHDEHHLTIIRGHEVRFPNLGGKYHSVIAVMATTIKGGVEYAEALGLKDYRVYRNKDFQKLQGLRVKAVVISPGYFEEAQEKMYKMFDGYNYTRHSQVMSKAPRG